MKPLIIILVVILSAWGLTSLKNKIKAIPAHTPAPVVTTTNATSTIQARFNDRATGAGISIMPVKLIQDSRCPASVQCIWAGTVIITVEISDEAASTTTNLTLGTPFETEEYSVVLKDVLPAKLSTEEASSSDYLFEFEAVNK